MKLGTLSVMFVTVWFASLADNAYADTEFERACQELHGSYRYDGGEPGYQLCSVSVMKMEGSQVLYRNEISSAQIARMAKDCFDDNKVVVTPGLKSYGVQNGNTVTIIAEAFNNVVCQSGFILK